MGDYINGPAFEFNTNDPILSENNKVNPDQAIQGSGGTVADATTTSKGKIQLAGDLGGTAEAPTVPKLATKQNILNGTGFTYINGTGVSYIKGNTSSFIRADGTTADFDTTSKATILSGLININGSILPADSMLVGFGKAQGQLNTKQNILTGTTRQVAIFDSGTTQMSAGLFRPDHWSQVLQGAPTTGGTWVAGFTNSPVDPSQDMFFLKTVLIPEFGAIPIHDQQGQLFVNNATDIGHAVNLNQLNSALTGATITTQLDQKIDKTGRTAGIETFTANGSSFVYTFPHGYVVSPAVIIVTRNQTTDFENFMTTWDDTNVTITYENPPAAGTVNLNWLAIL